MENSRRKFLKFLGVSTITISKLSLLGSYQSCSSSISEVKLPSFEDDLVLKDGLHYYNIISWDEAINSSQKFGFNNDYITFKPLSSTELIMWVNHEYTNPLFVSGNDRTKKNVDIERETVGGSIIKVKKVDNKWTFIPKDEVNKGVRATTPIPFANGVKINGTNISEGTCSNCAGGYTPWGTFLTCEENPHKNYGQKDPKTGVREKTRQQWEKFYPNPIEHYGWVVEVEPETGKAKKHTNLGRFGHESATPIISKSGNVVVYSGDDKADEHIYKFISASKNNLDKGVLYVASLEQKKWLPLDLNLSPILKNHFKTNLEIMINTRKAAHILGATELNRPEDIEIHPNTGDVYISLTNNKKKNDYFGSILKITEAKNDHSALTFEYDTFKFGGELSRFACPDNLAFDQNGNLWMASDISGNKIGTLKYKSFGNNGLFVIPTSGKNAGEVIQVASAPNDAEFTGLCFSPDQKTLFLSVQHPGELTQDLSKPTSTWPTGKLPKPTVVAIEGKYLESLTQA